MKIAPNTPSFPGDPASISATFSSARADQVERDVGTVSLHFARLQAAVDHTNMGVMMASHKVGENGVAGPALTFANTAFERISGYTASEVLGLNPRFLQGEGTGIDEVQRLREAVVAGQAHEALILNYRKDGTPFWNAMQIAPICDESGVLTDWIGFMSDVTARVEAETALLESRENLEAAQKLTHLGSWVMQMGARPEEDRLNWSDEVFRIVGLEPGSIVPSRESCLAMIHPADIDKALQLDKALAANTGFDVIYRIMRPSGEIRTVQVCARVERDSQGRPRRAVGTILDVTERHFAEIQAREATRNLQLVLQNAPIVLWAIDLEGVVIFARGQSLQQMIDRGEGHVGRSIFEIYAGNEPICDLAKRALTGIEVSGLIETNGLCFEAKYSPLRDETGALCGAVGLAHDITERRAIETALSDSQKQLSAVIDTLPMVLWAVDTDGIYTFRQGRALEMLGQKPGAAVGESIFDFYGEDGVMALCVRRALAGGIGQEVCYLRPDLAFELHCSPTRDENGHISGVVGVSYVVTERELARRELAESEARFDRIVANAPGMVYRFHRDAQGELGFSFVSDGCQGIYGVDAATAQANPRLLLDAVAPEECAAFRDSILESEAALTPWEWEGRIVRPDGEHRWIRAQSRPVRQEDGTTIWDGLVMDVTQTWQAQNAILQSRRALDEAQQLAHIGSFEWHLPSGNLRWSDEMFRIFGFEPGAFTPTTALVLDLITESQRELVRDRALATIRTYFPQPGPQSLRISISRADGQIRWIESHARTETDAAGRPVSVVGSAQDITESLLAEGLLRASEQRYALAARGANDGLWDWDLNLNCIYLSPRWKTMLGHADDEIGDDPDEWLGRVHSDDIDHLRLALAAHLAGESAHFECEYRLRTQGGEMRWMLGRALAVFGASGKAERLVGSQTDISTRKDAEAQLSHSAFYDKLTGLPNRTLFLDRLERTLSRAHRNPDYTFATLFLDIDRFKKINDSLGHMMGDELLIEAAARFSDCLRPGDTVARLGGDEFALLIDDVREQGDVSLVANRIQRALEAPFVLEGKEIFVTVSIGIAPYRGGEESPADLLRNADSAMYRAKGLGRARFETFDSAMHQRALHLLELETELWRAIERDELRLHYQPIVSLQGGEICGYEALVRWEHPTRGLVSPGDFIPIAEENGFIVPLGWWVLEEACRQARAWQIARKAQFPEARPHFMSVNLSSKQFSQHGMIEQVRGIIQNTGINANFLTFEITESVIMEHNEGASQTLRALKSMGIHLSMDDFGTGYSSLSYLHRFSLDTLKIDRSFVSQMRVGAREGEIVSTILALAGGLGMRVVAEGVETSEQLAGLRGMGCGYAQGFLMSKPLPAPEIEALLATAPKW